MNDQEDASMMDGEAPEEQAVDQAPEESTQDEQQDQPQQSAQSGNSGINKLPPEMMDEIKQGGAALFYTAVQVIGSRDAMSHVRDFLKKGKLSPATWFAMDQAMKIHKRQGIKMSPPMVIGATYYVAEYLRSLAEKGGQRVGDNQVRKAVVETIDKFMGQMKGYELAQQQKSAAAEAQQQAPSDQAGPQPDTGMGATGSEAPAPQGGMM